MTADVHRLAAETKTSVAAVWTERGWAYLTLLIDLCTPTTVG